MPETLLDQLLEEECTLEDWRLMKAEIANAANARPQFNFNRFEVIVNRDDKSVSISDVVQNDGHSTQNMSIPEFLHALERHFAAASRSP